MIETVEVATAADPPDIDLMQPDWHVLLTPEGDLIVDEDGNVQVVFIPPEVEE